MILPLLLGAAQASVPVTVCVDYTLGFDDSDVPGANEDYYATNASAPAKGITIRAQGSGGSQITKTAGTLLANGGCADFSLDAAQTWTIKVLGRVDLLLRSIELRSSGGSKGRWTHTPISDWTPVAGTYDVDLPAQARWSVLAAASHALSRNHASQTLVDLDYYTPHTDGTLYTPAGCSSPCVDGTDIYVDNDVAGRKFQVAYLQGWALLQHMGWSASDYDITFDEGFCGDGDILNELQLHTLETDRAALVEGFAHWYSATAFNDEDEDDCSYVLWHRANWDRLDVCFQDKEAPVGHLLSCSDGPSLPPYRDLVPETDYWAYCSLRSGEVDLGADSAFPLDVVRFLWERVRVDSGLTMNEVGESYNDLYDALPVSSWRTELQAAAVSHGADTTDWDSAEVEHGLNH